MAAAPIKNNEEIAG